MPRHKRKELQRVKLREPQQERSRQKVELILEASVRLLEQHGMEGLNTNAVAEKAGVSIGTLYQFFPNKDAILSRLADSEMQRMGARVTAAMQDSALNTPSARVGAIVRAVAETYGRRQNAHRAVMAHSLTRGGGNRLATLFAQLRTMLGQERGSGQYRTAMSAGDAFVVAHAFGGVLRAMTTDADAPPQAEIEQSLTRLITSFLQLPA